MKKVYRTALGKVIDIDSLRLVNEETIAIGNMKVNARGDELGPGGKVVKTRNQVMDEYYKLNTPMVTDSRPEPDNIPVSNTNTSPAVMPDAPGAAEPVSPTQANKLKGSLANSFAKK
jgi:hypothetical protein